jgi:hypothetical protein
VDKCANVPGTGVIVAGADIVWDDVELQIWCL